MEYDLELAKAAAKIKKTGAKLVCIQLPDGLKSKAKDIADELSKKTKAEIFIWMGSCYGGCDYPNLESLNVALLIQWGHSEFSK